jgi:hypothetical protein
MFRAWSCGHNHQEDNEGRTQTCGNANWYLLEVGQQSAYFDSDGLKDDDYTLHTRRDDGRFSAARWGNSNSRAKEIAHSDGRRLMVYIGDEWVEVP